MKKILFVLHDDYSKSGATASMLTVIKKIKENKQIDLEVLLPKYNGDLKSKLEEYGIKNKSLRYFGSRYYLNGFIGKDIRNYIIFLLKNIINLFSVIYFCLKNKKKYDVVYSNTSHIYIGSMIAYLIKAKHIWHIREFGWEDQRALHIFGDFLFYKYLEKSSNKIILISKALNSKVLRYIKEDNILSVIYNDIDNSDIYYYPERNFNKNNIKLLVVGTIALNKGQEFVIDQVSMLRKYLINTNLRIAGRGDIDYINKLRKKVEKLDLINNIEFLGQVKDLNSIRKDTDICIISSYSEAFGRVTIEAMLSGMVVVAYNGGANPELIENGITGYLYSNSLEFIEIIKNIKDNPSILDSIRKNAYSYACKFTLSDSSNKIEKIILEI